MALQICVEYAYTANLEVPDVLVQDVYLAAWQLRIDNVVRECARHLVEELCADSCIETRSLPGINKNKTFVQNVDTFIAKEVSFEALFGSYSVYLCIHIEDFHYCLANYSICSRVIFAFN